MKVFLVFDSEIIRRWLRMLVFRCPEAEIIGEAHDPIRALNAIRTLKPDVVIMDSRNKRRLGINVLLGMREQKPAPKVIMLTNKLYYRYERNGAGTQADFLVDAFSERHKLPGILSACARGGTIAVHEAAERRREGFSAGKGKEGADATKKEKRPRDVNEVSLNLIRE